MPVAEVVLEKCGLITVQGRQVPLTGVEIGGDVTGSHARVLVRQRYRNDETKPIEAVYTFPLPSDATLAGFSMTCAGRTLEGIVKEREEAFHDYDDAVSAGHGAALLDQERPNVFTAQVGNLLPGEETEIEVVYLQKTEVEEGSLRLTIPTLVAPRYIPGAPGGPRTGGGWADPTDRVPDADRISPPISGDVAYGLTLDLSIDLGREVQVESPSHSVTARGEDDGRLRVRLTGGRVSLDRDLVLLISSAVESRSAPLTAVTANRGESGPGTFAITVVPDLSLFAESGSAASRPQTNDVVFVIDVSGSMGGLSLPQAVAALRLCLRHLRSGDRFNVIAFSDDMESFRPGLVPFTEKTLREADSFAARLHPKGGTEMLEPLLAAVAQAPDGVVVVLTDGQVGNEDEILSRVLEKRGKGRVFAFGIGTNVSDALLSGLARQTGGALETIYPGERIDEKVVAQFSRATSERVEDLKLEWSGIEPGDLAPADPPALTDGEPWTLFGRYETPASGTLLLRGTRRGQPWSLAIPVGLPERAPRPHLVKLWAAERVRELLAAQLVGRRAHAMKQRIVALAVEHGLATPYSSFVVIEKRTGERRAGGQPETRFVPVAVPYGWAMFEPRDAAASAMPRGGVVFAAAPGAAYAAKTGASPRRKGAFARLFGSTAEAAPPDTFAMAEEAAPPVGARRRSVSGAPEQLGYDSAPSGLAGGRRPDPVVELLSRQLASGLWDGAPAEAGERVRATTKALVELEAAGVTSRHRLHGAQVKKAVEALLDELERGPGASAEEIAAALAIAWLVSAPRLRRRVEDLAARLAPGLTFDGR